MKFAIQSLCRNDHEGASVVTFCVLNRHEYKIFSRAKDVPADFTPVGTVKWVEEILGRPILPDYYPEFLSPWLHRKIWRSEVWPYGSRVFIKPSDRHKRFTGFITNGKWKGKKKPPFWCSEVVQFVSEWRWYIAAGRIADARWGSGEERPVPELDVEWPTGFFGAVDFGQLEDGRISLIESNSPFSCGWYGPANEASSYAEWLFAGWVHLNRSSQPDSR